MSSTAKPGNLQPERKLREVLDDDVGARRARKIGYAQSEELQSTADMTQFVQTLLNQMQTRFQAMSENIVSKIDEMGSRIDELEQSINDLKMEMGADTPNKSKLEDSKPAE